MFNLLFIFGAKYLFIFSILISGIYFLKQSWPLKKKIAIFGITSIVLMYSTALVVGHIYNNPRPFVVEHFIPLIPHTPDNGFPSDHVLLVSAIAAIILFFSRRIGALLWLITILVAISRVYVGVHHSVDVIASMIIALVVSYIVSVIVRKLDLNKNT